MKSDEESAMRLIINSVHLLMSPLPSLVHLLMHVTPWRF